MLLDGFTTDRLTARRWSDDRTDRARVIADLPGILSPAVLAPLPPSLQFDPDAVQAETWIAARAAESELFILSDRKDGGTVGLLMLVDMADEGGSHVLHLGYLLGEQAWGKGLATELVQGLVSSLQGRGPLRLIGGVGRDNPASARVLQKAGFVRDQDLSVEDTDMFVQDLT